MICDLNQPGRCAASTVAGVCIVKPTTCPIEILAAPVCGCDGKSYESDCLRQMAGAQLDHVGMCAVDGGVSDGSSVASCASYAAGFPDGGAHCAVSCDPGRPDGGICYGVPPYNAAHTSMAIWVEDSSAPSGGWRVTLSGSGAVTAGGHSYEDRGDGLVGTGGNGVYGDLFVARDGQAQWTGFHFEGFAAYQGNGVWDWPATLTVSQSGASAATFGRHYTISRGSPACGASSSYAVVADEPPRACANGVDLLSFVLPGN
jgi:hypothetical protein